MSDLSHEVVERGGYPLVLLEKGPFLPELSQRGLPMEPFGEGSRPEHDPPLTAWVSQGKVCMTGNFRQKAVHSHGSTFRAGNPALWNASFSSVLLN